MLVATPTFPLVPKRRLIGLSFGTLQSLRRGRGTDIAGSRPYRPGDDMRSIDWNSSAKLSSVRGSDEFIVRELYADEAPRVVIVCDRRPEMALFPDTLPWLSKPTAMREAARLIAASAAAAKALLGYLDLAEVENPDPELRVEEAFWRAPRSQSEFQAVSERHLEHPSFFAPRDNLTRAIDFLGSVRHSVPSGSFVFVLSDFLAAPADETWERALEHRWDVVPVVIQDPVWEASFPPVNSIVVPLADAATGHVRLVRLRRREAERRRQEHERRRDALLERFRTLGLDAVTITSDSPDEIYDAFVDWADERLFERRYG